MPSLASAQVHSTDQIEVELIAETTNVVPGETTWLAIRLDPIEHWHTYWKFGGDSGEATRAVDWQMPSGVTVGDIVWPIPDWTPFLGSELVTFTYEHEVFLPMPLTVPADFDGEQLDLTTTIEWQVCYEICIPGEADFALSLPVSDSLQIDSTWQAAFEETRALTPVPADSHNLLAQFNDHDGKINVMVQALDGEFSEVDEAWFFPTERRIMRYAPYRRVMVDGDRVQVSTEQHRRYDSALNELAGLISFIDDSGNRKAFDISARRTNIAWDNSIEVEFLAETTSIVPGETTWFGLRLDPAEHWHTYWKMGGDSGEPTSLNEWNAPEGTQIGELQFPAPHWLPFYETDLVNFGYEEEVFLPVAVTIPENYSGESVELSTLAYWNVCDQICIPGEQRFSITLPVAEVAELDAANSQLFAEAREQLPIVDHSIKSLIAVAGERVSLGFESPDPIFANYSEAWFFPDQRRVIKPGPLRDVSIQPNLLQITHQQPRRMLEDLSAVYGVLVLQDVAGNRTAYDFVNPAADANSTTIMPAAALTNNASGGGGGSIFVYMGFAFLGGMILNLMPCVFPVLSIKALSFTKNIGESQRKQRMDGIMYAVGVVAAFVVLASVLIALRAGGEAVGWAFQFQQPWFLAFIVYLFFLMGLSLSGVFEIGTGLMGAGSSLTAQGGYKGSFFTGVLATTVATPCTAPFMGPAIGFALAQSWLVAMTVFISLGLGMALPILLLSFMPSLFRYLPKPGPWMETFKQFMAFPLYASALFFLWVLGNQVGVMGMSLVLGVCVLLAFAAWLYQRRYNMGFVFRTVNYAVGLGTIALALYLMQSPFMQTLAPAVASADGEGGQLAGQNYEVFSSQRLDSLRAEGRPVFVNMTAAWCITCLANEQTSLSTDRVQESMASNDITYMKGDWTNEDPEITAVLEYFNRPSVPLYVLYPGDVNAEPIILPQILTPGILTDAFESI